MLRFGVPVFPMETRSSLERVVFCSISGTFRQDTVQPTARYQCDISKKAVLLERNDAYVDGPRLISSCCPETLTERRAMKRETAFRPVVPNLFLTVAHFDFKNFPWPHSQSIAQELDLNFPAKSVLNWIETVFPAENK